MPIRTWYNVPASVVHGNYIIIFGSRKIERNGVASNWGKIYWVDVRTEEWGFRNMKTGKTKYLQNLGC